ncbi:hypothetical protein XNC3_2850001 [Xenorhabdus nematophila F1]|nr:hypothetical protein XNC3_2850001 [Xenorhabdus nematophila F1]
MLLSELFYCHDYFKYFITHVLFNNNIYTKFNQGESVNVF